MISADDATRSAWADSLRASPVLCHLAEDQLRRLIEDGFVVFSGGNYKFKMNLSALTK